MTASMTIAPKMQQPPLGPVSLQRDATPGGAAYESQVSNDAKALLDAAKNHPAVIPDDVVQRGAEAMMKSLDPNAPGSMPVDHTGRVGDRVFELCRTSGLQPAACQEIVGAYDQAALARASELALRPK
jgi:hypothetical protein